MSEKRTDNSQSQFILHQTLRTHRQEIHQIVWSPDGRMLASAVGNRCILIWDTSTWKIHQKLRKLPLGVHCIAWAPEGKTVAAGGNGGVILCDSETGQVIQRLSTGTRNIICCIAWARDGNSLAAGSDDKCVYTWRRQEGQLCPTFIGHSGAVRSLAWSHDCRKLASGSEDNTVRLWMLDNEQDCLVCTEHTDTVSCLAWSSDGTFLASGSADRTILLWDPQTGRAQYRLEGHTAPITSITLLAKKNLLSSKDLDGAIRLWHTDSWTTLGVLQEPFSKGNYLDLAFHPEQPLLASLDQSSTGICIWNLDFASVLTIPTTVDPIYANAKIVIVGGSGVGKSDLGLALTGEPYTTRVSTSTRNSPKIHVRVLDRQQDNSNERREIHETLLWDLAGEPGYNLIQPLYLHGVALALIVFDAKSPRGSDPFSDVRRWDRVLRSTQSAQRDSALPLKKFLVETRIDVGRRNVSDISIASLLKELNFDGYFPTSAKEGWGITELRQAIKDAIEWEALPRVTSTNLFQRIKAFLMVEKEAERVLSTIDELYRDFLKSEKTLSDTRDLQMHFETCVRLLDSQGLLREFSFGQFSNWILLQPELLDNYAIDLLNAVRDEPEGFGSISEEDVRLGTYFTSAQEYKRLKNKKDEKLLLLAMIEDFWYHDIALSEETSKGRILVFPSQATRTNPTLPDPEEKAVTFSFKGIVTHVYTTLAVRLAHSDIFTKESLWKNAVIYISNIGETCGISLREIDEEQGELSVFFGKTVSEGTRMHLVPTVHAHLQRRAQITHIEVWLNCPNCGTKFTSSEVTGLRKVGRTKIRCIVCSTETELPVWPNGKKEFAEAYLKTIQQMDFAADRRRKNAIDNAQLQGRKESGDFDACFLYDDEDKLQVKYIGEKLEKEYSILSWLQDWDLRPGHLKENAIEQQIIHSKVVVVFIGKGKINNSQLVHIGVAQETFEKNGKEGFIIPVLLPIAPAGRPDFPSILRLMNLIDFHSWDPEPLKQLAWGIIGKKQ